MMISPTNGVMSLRQRWKFLNWNHSCLMWKCQIHLSSVLNVLFGGTKQGKAYAVAYALLTRVQVLLTHLKVPYADLTLTNFDTSPQFGLTRSNFYMQESKQ